MTAGLEIAADGSFTRLPAATLYGHGVRILVCYATGAGKAISRREWDDYLRFTAPDGGKLALMLVDEHNNQQMLNGPGFGTRIATEMIQAAGNLGLPNTRPLFYVMDDPNALPPASWAEVADRCREICAVHQARGWVLPGDQIGSSLVGGYGSGPLLEHLYGLNLLRWPWAVSTWGPCPHAVLVQNANTRKDRLGGAIDWDIVPAGVVDCGQYPPPHQLVPTGDDMNGVALSLFQPNQMDTFRVDGQGVLVHRYFIRGVPGPTGTAGWQREDLAVGLQPSSAVYGPVFWSVDGFIHLWVQTIDDIQMELIWDGKRWLTAVEGPTPPPPPPPATPAA